MPYTFPSEFHSFQLRLHVFSLCTSLVWKALKYLTVPSVAGVNYLAWQRFAVASCRTFVACVVFIYYILITSYFTSHFMFILCQVAVTIPSSATASPSASSLPSVATVNTASSAPLGEFNFD